MYQIVKVQIHFYCLFYSAISLPLLLSLSIPLFFLFTYYELNKHVTKLDARPMEKANKQ